MNNLKKAFWSLLVLSILAACKSDDATSSKIQLFSFGPTGVQPGEKIKFIGQNLNQVTSIILPPNIEIPASQFVTTTGSLLEVVVPDDAAPGKVVLKTPQGDIETKSMISFLAPVAITSITPEARPGSDITIKGTLLNWVESITFTDNLKVTDFKSQSTTELVVTVPATAKTGGLIFETGGTKPLKFTSTDPLIVTLPNVTALSPASVKHAENLTLTGTDLDLVTSVTFPDKTKVTSFVNQTATQLVVVVPVTAVDGALTLTVASGVTVVTTQTIKIVLPNVTAFSPSDPSGQVAGATLTMTGTDLDLVKSIKFPNVANQVTSFTLTGTTQIDVVIPSGATGGTVILTTIHDFAVPVQVAFGDQLTLLLVAYDDATKSPFGFGGGWGGSSTDGTSTDNPRVGTKSIKTTFNGGYSGAAQLGTWGGSPVSTSGSNYFAFSVYGGTGTGGKTLLINLKDANDTGSQSSISVDEGKWKDVKISLSSFGSPGTIKEISFQDAGWTGTVYIDQVGLK